MKQLNEAQYNALKEHAGEITKLVRGTAPGFRIMAEVYNDGSWANAGWVTTGVGSFIAHNDKGTAIFFDCNPFKSRKEVDAEIDDAYFGQE